MSLVNANSVDPDQTPRSAASDLGLHCLPMSHLGTLVYVSVEDLAVRRMYVEPDKLPFMFDEPTLIL